MQLETWCPSIGWRRTRRWFCCLHLLILMPSIVYLTLQRFRLQQCESYQGCRCMRLQTRPLNAFLSLSCCVSASFLLPLPCECQSTAARESNTCHSENTAQKQHLPSGWEGMCMEDTFAAKRFEYLESRSSRVLYVHRNICKEKKRYHIIPSYISDRPTSSGLIPYYQVNTVYPVIEVWRVFTAAWIKPRLFEKGNHGLSF